MRSPTLFALLSFGLAAFTSGLTACGSSASKSSPACDLMRPAFVENERERAASDDRTRGLAEAERQKVTDGAVAAAMAVCVEDHWTDAMVKCLLAKPGAKGSDCGFPPPGFHHLNTAVEATYARAYGPRKASDDNYTQWAGQHSAAHRNADGSPEMPQEKTSHAGLGTAAAKMVGSDAAGSDAGSAAAPSGGW
jgi:hypothetical protein